METRQNAAGENRRAWPSRPSAVSRNDSKMASPAENVEQELCWNCCGLHFECLFDLVNLFVKTNSSVQIGRIALSDGEWPRTPADFRALICINSWKLPQPAIPRIHRSWNWNKSRNVWHFLKLDLLIHFYSFFFSKFVILCLFFFCRFFFFSNVFFVCFLLFEWYSTLNYWISSRRHWQVTRRWFFFSHHKL